MVTKDTTFLGKFSNKHPEEIGGKFYSARDAAVAFMVKLNQEIMSLLLMKAKL